jgi:hypothetical protein
VEKREYGSCILRSIRLDRVIGRLLIDSILSAQGIHKSMTWISTRTFLFGQPIFNCFGDLRDKWFFQERVMISGQSAHFHSIPSDILPTVSHVIL